MGRHFLKTGSPILKTVVLKYYALKCQFQYELDMK